jgi:hypothetical protein
MQMYEAVKASRKATGTVLVDAPLDTLILLLLLF